jgi:hypothetical protein
MIVYYRDPHIEVTSEALHLGDATFPLVALEYVWHREGERETSVRLRPVRRGAIGFGLIMGGLLAAIGVIYLLATSLGQAASAGRVLLPLAVVVVLIGFAGPIIEMAMHRIDDTHDQGSEVREIWALINGVEQLLVRESDAHRFGKIYRALQRAIENHGG